MIKKIHLILIFILFLLFVPIISYGAQDTFESMEITITVKSNGNAEVNEIWKMNLNSGTEVYKVVSNVAPEAIADFKVSEGNTTFKNYGLTWKNQNFKTLVDKENRCGIIDESTYIELCWGIGEFGSHEYNISYTIKNFIKEYDSYQMAYLSLVPANMDPVPENVTINVEFDEEIPASSIQSLSLSSGGFSSQSISSGKFLIKSNADFDNSTSADLKLKLALGTIDIGSEEYLSQSYTTEDDIEEVDETETSDNLSYAFSGESSEKNSLGRNYIEDDDSDVVNKVEDNEIATKTKTIGEKIFNVIVVMVIFFLIGVIFFKNKRQ